MRRPGSRLILPALCVLTSFAGAPLITAASQPPAERPTQSPFYCDREALSPAERTRHFDVLEPALIAKRQAVRELPDGYEIQFASDKQTFQDLCGDCGYVQLLLARSSEAFSGLLSLHINATSFARDSMRCQ
jgi:hypothetical protein